MSPVLCPSKPTDLCISVSRHLIEVIRASQLLVEPRFQLLHPGQCEQVGQCGPLHYACTLSKSAGQCPCLDILPCKVSGDGCRSVHKDLSPCWESVQASFSCLSCRMGHWLGTPQLWSLATPTSKKNRRAPPSSFTWLSHPSYCHEPVPHSLCHHAGEPHFDPATTAIAEAGGHMLANSLLANLAQVMCTGQD